MSRAKVTFREGKKLRRKPQPLVWLAGEHSSDWQLKRDEELAPRLAEIIQTARDNYAQRRTPSQDIRATLRALARIEDEQAARAVALIDDFTEAQLATTAARLWRRENPSAEAVPVDLFDFCGWTPDRIQLTAKEALRGMSSRPGRALKRCRDLELATALAAYWWNVEKKRPTVVRKKLRRGTDIASGKAPDKQYSEESEFLRWAADMFHRAGRWIPSDSLAPVLRKATKRLPRTP